jgi:hypothetical protein
MPRYSTILTNLINRITAHNATGQLLAGWKWVALPSTEVEGESTLAGGVIRMWLPDIKEKAHEQLTIIANGTMTARFTVSTKKDSGIPAHVLACEKVMDAIERNGAVIDLLLGATLVRPMELAVTDPFIPENGGISINSHIVVTMTPKAFKSGTRSA